MPFQVFPVEIDHLFALFAAENGQKFDVIFILLTSGMISHSNVTCPLSWTGKRTP